MDVWETMALEQALVIESERGDYRIGITYGTMGDVLVAQEGLEKEGILMYQNIVGLFEKANLSKDLIGCSSNSVMHT